MMLFLLSKDELLVARCVDLLGGPGAVQHLHDIDGIEDAQKATGNVLIIDLEGCDEKRLTALTMPTVALASRPRFEQAVRLLQRGVRGYGNRHMHRDNLMQAVTAAREGQVWLPPDIVNRMITAMPVNGNGHAKPSFPEKLSKREDEVVQLVANGLSNKEIADKLFISVRTVKAHLTSIFSKTGFRDRLELAVKMRRH
jgi:DNA-binding NarL/FixJ family response regulator